MKPKTFRQDKLGKTILIISVIFVFLFLAMLIFKWFKNPEMFLPIFG
jgi:membrane protein involved in colicin uptake